jgi:hypothetical protein
LTYPAEAEPRSDVAYSRLLGKANTIFTNSSDDELLEIEKAEETQSKTVVWHIMDKG